jgi:Protein of unknown function (DUF2510)
MDIPTTQIVAQIEAGGHNMITEPAWLADPTGRHQTRYWNGRDWTEHVADDGVAGVDPLTMPPPPAATVPFPAPAPFVAPTPRESPSPQQSGARKWLVIAIPVVVIASIIAVVVVRDSSTSSGGVGASSGGGTGGGKGVSVEYTDGNGYQYVVTHTGEVKLQASIAQISPGFEVVHVVGGKLSVVNANSGRNAPMPDVRLLAYVPEPDCGFQSTVVPNPSMRTEVSVPTSCFIKSRSSWSIEADEANGLRSIDNPEGILAPGQTAVAAVDETWVDESDLTAAVPDTVDVSGPFVWGIEVVEDSASFGSDAPPSCFIRLVGSPPLVQELIDTEAQVEYSVNGSFQGDTYRCDVGAA